MSKLYKSEQCVEADPCRLVPADVEAFFINDDFHGKTGGEAVAEEGGSRETTETINTSEEATASPETAAALETASATETVEASNETEGSDAVSENAKPKPELEKLFDVAGHIRSLLEAGHQAMEMDSGKKTVKSETEDIDAGTPSEGKKGTPRTFNPPKYHTEKTATAGLETHSEADLEAEAEAARERAKQLFTEAQREAGEMTSNAKNQAESLLSQAQLQMKQRLEGAEQQAGSILTGAQQQAGQITSGASQQAKTLLQDAEKQAELIVESSRQKVLVLIENAKKEAEKITGAAQQEAAELTAAAKKEADDLRKTATEESIQLKEQARQEGLEAGRGEGAAQIRQELEQNLATALALVNQAEEERLKRIGSSEPELLKLAVAIAEKIIGAELQSNPETLLEITREALSRVAMANNIVIRVNQEDLKVFTEHSAVLQKAFTEPKMIRIEEDPGVVPGNCFIETEHGNIDPRIKSQLELIWAELLKAGAIS